VKYSVITFGCRVNQADSLGFEEELRAAGAVAVPPDTADLVVVNTCSVTATADQGARQTIRRIARDNPGARIVVTGCYATRAADAVAALPNVARVVVNDGKPQLISVVMRDQQQRDLGERGLRLQPDHRSADVSTADRFANGDGACGALIEPGVAGRTAFTLRVQTGCAEPCSYCIIPTTRGVPRSVRVEEVLREVERVAAAGFKEIALTGVHLGSYGRDLEPRTSLADLLRALERGTKPSCRHPRENEASAGEAAGGDDATPTAAQPSDVLFRISSLEPMDCSREIVDLVATSDRFAPHFHLPLQHASDRLLSAMRRPYTLAQYASLVDDIRARITHASIGSDIIVGFPGETDVDFDRLATFLERSPLTHLHVFPYSDRPGTPASTMHDKVPGGVIRERARHVREIGQRLAERFRDAQIGTTHRALTLEDGSLAVTGNYLKVRIPAGRARNEWVRLRMTSHHDGELLGG
jgi:threonylcarbamoyladenosine tRNA methylthiotransferase MtaB